MGGGRIRNCFLLQAKVIYRKLVLIMAAACRAIWLDFGLSFRATTPKMVTMWMIWLNPNSRLFQWFWPDHSSSCRSSHWSIEFAHISFNFRAWLSLSLNLEPLIQRFNHRSGRYMAKRKTELQFKFIQERLDSESPKPSYLFILLEKKKNCR